MKKTFAVVGLLALGLIVGSSLLAQDANKEKIKEAAKEAAKEANDAPKDAAKGDLKDVKSRASYSIGLNIGRNMIGQAKQYDLDLDAMQKGIRDTLAGSKLALTDAECEQAIRSLQERIMAQREAKAGPAKKDGEAFLAANKVKPGVKVTKSGLQYKVLKEGSGTAPKESDRVRVHYRGTLIDGTEFGSSLKRNRPFDTDVTGVIPGWIEGLQLMTPGSKYEFVIPSNLAYGPDGSGASIPPDSVLVFEVELLKVL